MSASTTSRRSFRQFTFSVPWNLALITAGAFLIAVAIKAVAVPHGLLTGGMSGLGLLCYYLMPAVSPGWWYFLLNVPIFVLGWLAISRRFFLYSLFGMAAVSLFVDLMPFVLPLGDIWLAVFTGGAVLGTGMGVTLRSMGSTGGVDILAVMAKERWNVPLGTFVFWFDTLVFGAGFWFLKLDVMLYSLAMLLVSALVMDWVLNLFSRRIMVLIVTDRHREVLDAVLRQIDRGATLLHGQGGYSGESKEVVLTMVGNTQLKRLEELTYSIDPKAFTITGTGFHVTGEGFSERKIY